MKRLIITLLTLLPVNLFAADMIESIDTAGNLSRIYIEGDRAHMEMPQKQGYMVLDVKNNTMKAVIHEQRTVIDMSDLLKNKARAGSADKQVKSSMKSKGPGPEIVGYKTEQYDMYGNGKYCGSSFVSVAAVRDLGVKKFARAMQTMASQVKNRMSGMGMNQFASSCQQAHMQLSDQLQDLGMPLRTVDENQRLQSEVKRISKNVKLPAGAFNIPADYQEVNPDKMIQDAMKQMPDMQEMMKNMPPEAMDMMRKRMQQMQQQ